MKFPEPELRVSTPQRCRGALSKSKAKLGRIKSSMRSTLEQLDTRSRATLFSLQNNELATVKNDVVNMHDYIKSVLNNIEQQASEVQDSVSDAMRENTRMCRTLEALLYDD